MQRKVVGTATFTFTDGNTGTFAYQVNDGATLATKRRQSRVRYSGRLGRCANSRSARIEGTAKLHHI